jgi:NTP pyrophosphatase (non-canonical NTP hydrolase)
MDTSRELFEQGIKAELATSAQYLMWLAATVREIADRNGWTAEESPWQNKYYVPSLLALITSEVSEALEAFRKDDTENFAEEIADVIIRVLDVVAILDIDIAKAVVNKGVKNLSRGYRHGGKRV